MTRLKPRSPRKKKEAQQQQQQQQQTQSEQKMETNRDKERKNHRRQQRHNNHHNSQNPSQTQTPNNRGQANANDSTNPNKRDPSASPASSTTDTTSTSKRKKEDASAPMDEDGLISPPEVKMLLSPGKLAPTPAVSPEGPKAQEDEKEEQKQHSVEFKEQRELEQIAYIDENETDKEKGKGNNEIEEGDKGEGEEGKNEDEDKGKDKEIKSILQRRSQPTRAKKQIENPYFVNTKEQIKQHYWQIMSNCAHVRPFTEDERNGEEVKTRFRNLRRALSKSMEFCELIGVEVGTTFDLEDVADPDYDSIVTESILANDKFYENAETRVRAQKFLLQLVKTPLHYSKNWNQKKTCFENPTAIDRLVLALIRFFGPVPYTMDYGDPKSVQPEQVPKEIEQEVKDITKSIMTNPYKRKTKQGSLSDSGISSLTNSAEGKSAPPTRPKGAAKKTFFDVTLPPHKPIDNTDFNAKNEIVSKYVTSLLGQLFECDDFLRLLPTPNQPDKQRPESKPKQVKKGSQLGDYPLTGPRFSHYAPNYYVRQSGDAVKVRLYIYHYKDAEEICKKMNEPKEDDDEDLVVPKDQELQFLVTVASVQTAIPTATHFLYPSSRYMDLDRLIKEIKEDTAYKSLPFQPTLGAEVRMIKMNRDERPAREEMAFAVHILCAEEHYTLVSAVIGKIYSQDRKFGFPMSTKLTAIPNVESRCFPSPEDPRPLWLAMAYRDAQRDYTKNLITIPVKGISTDIFNKVIEDPPISLHKAVMCLTIKGMEERLIQGFDKVRGGDEDEYVITINRKHREIGTACVFKLGIIMAANFGNKVWTTWFLPSYRNQQTTAYVYDKNTQEYRSQEIRDVIRLQRTQVFKDAYETIADYKAPCLEKQTKIELPPGFRIKSLGPRIENEDGKSTASTIPGKAETESLGPSLDGLDINLDENDNGSLGDYDSMEEDEANQQDAEMEENKDQQDQEQAEVINPDQPDSASESDEDSVDEEETPEEKEARIKREEEIRETDLRKGGKPLVTMLRHLQKQKKKMTMSLKLEDSDRMAGNAIGVATYEERVNNLDDATKTLWQRWKEDAIKRRGYTEEETRTSLSYLSEWKSQRKRLEWSDLLEEFLECPYPVVHCSLTTALAAEDIDIKEYMDTATNLSDGVVHVLLPSYQYLGLPKKTIESIDLAMDEHHSDITDHVINPGGLLNLWLAMENDLPLIKEKWAVLCSGQATTSDVILEQIRYLRYYFRSYAKKRIMPPIFPMPSYLSTINRTVDGELYKSVMAIIAETAKIKQERVLDDLVLRATEVIDNDQFLPIIGCDDWVESTKTEALERSPETTKYITRWIQHWRILHPNDEEAQKEDDNLHNIFSNLIAFHSTKSEADTGQILESFKSKHLKTIWDEFVRKKWATEGLIPIDSNGKPTLRIPQWGPLSETAQQSLSENDSCPLKHQVPSWEMTHGLIEALIFTDSIGKTTNPSPSEAQAKTQARWDALRGSTAAESYRVWQLEVLQFMPLEDPNYQE